MGYERGMWDTDGKVAKEQTALKRKPRGKKGGKPMQKMVTVNLKGMQRMLESELDFEAE